MFETYVDTMPIGTTKYLIAIIHKDDNTISIVGCDDKHDLSYCGLENIEDCYKGESYEVYDDEGMESEIIRLH